jgi:hypothetical protein
MPLFEKRFIKHIHLNLSSLKVKIFKFTQLCERNQIDMLLFRIHSMNKFTNNFFINLKTFLLIYLNARFYEMT